MNVKKNRYNTSLGGGTLGNVPWARGTLSLFHNGKETQTGIAVVQKDTHLYYSIITVKSSPNARCYSYDGMSSGEIARKADEAVALQEEWHKVPADWLEYRQPLGLRVVAPEKILRSAVEVPEGASAKYHA